MGSRRSRTLGVVRVGASLEPDLLRALDAWTKERNSRSRSDSIRFLIRKELAEKELDDPDADSVGTLMVLFRHDAPSVLRRLVEAQHRWGDHIRSSSHVHLEAGACVEAMVLAGRRTEIEKAAEDIRGVKGIIQGRFVVTTPAVAGGVTGHRHPHHPPR